MSVTSQGLEIMIDTETFGLGNNAVVWQAAFIAADANSLDDPVKFDSFYLPIQPQLDAGRTVDAQTFGYWMIQSDDARKKVLECIDGDADELTAYVRAFIRKIHAIMQDYPASRIWARGPQFDIVKLESLFAMCGEEAPWKYNQVNDLRTLMNHLNIPVANIPSGDIVPHVALEDCRFQMRCLNECLGTMI